METIPVLDMESSGKSQLLDSRFFSALSHPNNAMLQKFVYKLIRHGSERKDVCASAYIDETIQVEYGIVFRSYLKHQFSITY